MVTYLLRCRAFDSSLNFVPLTLFQCACSRPPQSPSFFHANKLALTPLPAVPQSTRHHDHRHHAGPDFALH
ncbi:hypothetical protein B0H10DRAFT_2049007 [Mycena sp. CBHHK59/15]|nr:hypothetical protein B0H10DRAFT_2049007 [Mycena sp. CBHHK59/15]